jgi:hypothetical protein
MPDYLVRLAQVHESFRRAELVALAELAGVEIEFVSYHEDVRLIQFLFPSFLFFAVLFLSFPLCHVFFFVPFVVFFLLSSCLPPFSLFRLSSLPLLFVFFPSSISYSFPPSYLIPAHHAHPLLPSLYQRHKPS